MALDLRDCTFFGPAMPEPFVKFQLEGELGKRKLLPRTTGEEGRTLEARWEVYRRKLRALGEQGGDRRVASHVLEPLAERLGYEQFARQAEVITREGPEDGGWLFTAGDSPVLRAWSVGLGTDLDAPSRRGRAYRFSPSRVAQRVLLAKSERAALLTDGEELRLLLCDPARPDGHIAVRLDRSGGWRSGLSAPDSYRLLLALASPAGVAALPDLAEAARLAQSTVTKKLRLQARRAIEGFIQEILDHPENEKDRAGWADQAELARTLWREGLILVYRLLFVFKLESSADPARAFSFAATSLWRNTYSPNTALAPLVRKVLDHGADSGGFLEGGLRTLWRLFAEGMSSSELEVKALGGMLFGEGTTPLLDRLRWGERAVARLLDVLLWTPSDGRTERERVHYGALDVEDLGRVYEALLELEPGITTEPMCRLRRGKIEVVVPIAQGAPYHTGTPAHDLDEEMDDTDEGDEDPNDEEEDAPHRPGRRQNGGKTKVHLVEDIPAGRFFLRVGLGRKASGSYYTPHPFVRFLVQETLGPLLSERSRKGDPRPGRILELKVLDPAMGSGHFLVEACRYLGEALYESCRLCDELALQAEEQAEKAPGTERERLLTHAGELRKRVEDLPDPENEMVAYLPSRASEGEETGLSQKKAETLCRRLIAVHCLYGVDKNPLAVELAKLSLWLESYAEGLPLTFMNHRLVPGDSLTGPFFEHLFTYPKRGEKLDDLFTQNLTERLQATLAAALVHVRSLEASVGKDVADLEQKRAAKEKLDAALAPLKLLAAAWSGGVMLGDGCDEAGYQMLSEAVGKGEETRSVLAARPRLREMVAVGEEGLAFELAFPEVFYPSDTGRRRGFDAVLGNPPWDKVIPLEKEFYAGFDATVLAVPTARERKPIYARLRQDPDIRTAWDSYAIPFAFQRRLIDRSYSWQSVMVETASGASATSGHGDRYRYFVERCWCLQSEDSLAGLVLPNSFYANEGSTGVRRLLLERARWQRCVGFVNTRKLFEIGTGQRFCLVVFGGAGRPVCPGILARFGAIGSEALSAEALVRDSVLISLSFIERTSPDYHCLLECSAQVEVDVVGTLFERATSFGEWTSTRGVDLYQEMNMTTDSPRFVESRTILEARDPRLEPTRSTLKATGWLTVHEKGTFFTYDDLVKDQPRYVCNMSKLHGGPVTVDSNGDPIVLGSKPRAIYACRYFRVAARSTIHASEEEKSVFAVLPPLCVVGNSALVEGKPETRSVATGLLLVALANSRPFNFIARLRIGTNLNQFLLNALPLPITKPGADRLMVHSALRLVCSHKAFGPLWIEQIGNVWRELTPRQTWPVLMGEDTRWAVRVVIDAVVSEAYGLNREKYAHVLSTFSHRSYPRARELCLTAFDELKDTGIEAFVKRYDPYWDVPLNESLPKPVTDLPPIGEVEQVEEDLGPLFKGGGQVDEPTRALVGRPRSARSSLLVDGGAYDTIARLLDARGVISSGDAQQATGLDASAVRPHLRRLVEEGHAVTEGERRGMKYRRLRDA